MRQQLQLLLLIALVVALGFAGYHVLFGSGPGFELVVVSATDATAKIEGESRVELVAGTVIPVDTRLETGLNGQALLQYGDNAELVVLDRTTIQVTGADPTGLRVELESGTVSARVRQGATPLRVSNRGRAIGATDADFTVMVGSRGPMSASTTRGSATVVGVDGTRQLEPLTALHIDQNNKATALPVAESLLFEVEWPDARLTRESSVEVTGTTDPYATVTLGVGPDAVSVRADRDGRFRAVVPLLEGDNDIELRARDATGREASRRQALNRDTTAPVIEAAEVVWGQ